MLGKARKEMLGYEWQWRATKAREASGFKGSLLPNWLITPARRLPNR